MVYEQEVFDTEAQADKYIEDYCRNYHPAGYGTVCRKKKLDGGGIQVNVSRGSSCD